MYNINIINSTIESGVDEISVQKKNQNKTEIRHKTNVCN